MKLLIFLTLLSGFAFAESNAKLGNVIEEGHLDPTVEGAKMPGTREDIDEVNTSPNPVPQAEEYDSNDVLIDGDYVQDQGSDLNIKKQRQEDKTEE